MNNITDVQTENVTESVENKNQLISIDNVKLYNSPDSKRKISEISGVFSIVGEEVQGRVPVAEEDDIQNLLGWINIQDIIPEDTEKYQKGRIKSTVTTDYYGNAAPAWIKNSIVLYTVDSEDQISVRLPSSPDTVLGVYHVSSLI